MFALIGNLGWTEVLLIFLIALIIFGPSRLPELAKSIGKGLREFKKAARGIEDEINKPVDEVKNAGYQQREEIPQRGEGSWKLSRPHDEVKQIEDKQNKEGEKS
ncbi:MAG: twin-arginine translocase TatA/TatE family subunit [Deltaproteobacteria bacterium]|nr:twin-arginine translocase TatA/TatE family subunit [Deltaproteobacteria bacterium]